jgi:hypothetical protein
MVGATDMLRALGRSWPRRGRLCSTHALLGSPSPRPPQSDSFWGFLTPITIAWLGQFPGRQAVSVEILLNARPPQPTGTFHLETVTMAFAVGNKLSVRSTAARPSVARRQVVSVRAAAVAGEVPDMNKRNIMNLILLGGVGVPATGMLGAYALFFVPKS